MSISNPRISFELFPPKTEAGYKKLAETTEQLARYNPDFFSVTCGAGGQATKVKTVELVDRLITQRYAVTPHISSINATRSSINKLLEYYRELNIKQLVIIRGDLLEKGRKTTSDFNYAHELVSYIRQTTGNLFKIIVAAYPEFHPEAGNATSDLFNFKQKINAGADAAITQYFYNSDSYYRFLESCQQYNINVPIIPGVMPISSYGKLKRFSTICQAEIPQWLDKRLLAYHDDPVSFKAFSIDVVSKLCTELLALGAPKLHFYTLNLMDSVQCILKNIDEHKQVYEALVY